MSRHNRRRTRGGHKASSSTTSSHSSTSTSSSSSLSMGMAATKPDLPGGPYGLQHPDFSSAYAHSYAPTINRTNSISARHWHNRYMAWQARERKAREDGDRKMLSNAALTAGNVAAPAAMELPVVSQAAKEKAKTRIFGDASDDESGEEEDDEMCKRMWEYFGGLDFIFDG